MRGSGWFSNTHSCCIMLKHLFAVSSVFLVKMLVQRPALQKCKKHFPFFLKGHSAVH